MNETTLTRSQIEMEARCNGDEYLTDVTVLTERKGEIEAQIAAALGLMTSKGGKIGACVIAMQPMGSVTNGEPPVPVMDIKLVLRVLENPLFNLGPNGTGKRGASIARRLVDLFYLYKAPGIFDAMRPDQPTILPVRDRLAPVAYDVQFVAREATRRVPHTQFKVAAVSLAKAGTVAPWTVTLGCGTPDATIYYSLDDSYPGANAGTLYTAPFAVSSAASVRAVGHKSGLIPSDAAVLTLE